MALKTRTSSVVEEAGLPPAPTDRTLTLRPSLDHDMCQGAVMRTKPAGEDTRYSDGNADSDRVEETPETDH